MSSDRQSDGCEDGDDHDDPQDDEQEAVLDDSRGEQRRKNMCVSGGQGGWVNPAWKLGGLAGWEGGKEDVARACARVCDHSAFWFHKRPTSLSVTPHLTAPGAVLTSVLKQIKCLARL